MKGTANFSLGLRLQLHPSVTLDPIGVYALGSV